MSKMRFTTALVILAGSAVAHTSVVYSTDYEIVTSCGPTVTNCPARSTVTSSTVYSTRYETLTKCAASVTNCPATVVTHTTPLSTPLSTPLASHTPAIPTPAPPTTSSFGNGTVPVPPTYLPKPPPAFGTSVGVLPMPIPAPSASSCVPGNYVETFVSDVTIVTSSVYYKTHSQTCSSGPATTPAKVYSTGGKPPAPSATPVPSQPGGPPASAEAGVVGSSAVLLAAALVLLA